MTNAPAADADFPPQLLEELLRQLDKVVRARQLYLANNPTYLRTLEGLRAAFAQVWEHTDAFTLQVTDTQFRWDGRAVHEQSAKASDSLPWLCYKDGLRELTLRRGFEAEELDRLVEMFPKVRRSQADADDLITLLWEQEFEFLAYRHVDLVPEGMASLPSTGEPLGQYVGPTVEGQASSQEASASAREEANAPQAQRPGVVSMEDFDSTLYFLDQREIEYVRGELAREYSMDLRDAVMRALLDIVETQTAADARDEAISLLEQMVLNLLSAGRFQTVAELLRELAAVATTAKALEAAHVERLRSLPARLSDPATLSQVLQQLDDSASLPSATDLSALFSELNASALGTIFEWLSRIRNSALRQLLESAAERLAAANTAEVVRLIGEGGAVGREAIKRAAALKTGAAVGPLTKVLGDTAKEMRAAAVAALVEIGSPGAMQALERALTDGDRDVRLTAVRTLATRNHRAAFPRVDAIVKAKEIRDADLSERMAFFEAYGALGGDAGVPFLDNILNGKSGLLGRREDPELRACAAMGLGRIRTPRAEQSLQKAMSEKETVVRTAVARALKGSAT